MTKLPGVPDSPQIVDGMAFFAGSGFEGDTCGGCIFRGYYRRRLHETYDPKTDRWVVKTYKHNGCEMFKKLSGRHGPVVAPDNKSCKYFEARPVATVPV